MSRKASIWAGGIAPVNSATTWPSRNAFTAGIPWTPKLAESDWFESTSTLASSTLPARLSTAASSAGPSWRQGPHHSAQKSTTTGSSRERSTTSVMNSASFDVLDHGAIEISERAESARWLIESRRETRRLPESLRGKLLIASPALVDPNFARSVVLITEHGDEGAMGVVLNRPSEIEVADVAPGARRDRRRRAGVHRRPGAAAGAGRAGRVQPSRGRRLDRRRRRRLRRRRDRVSELSSAVRRGRVYAGYSGWGAGQLEAELDRGGLDRRAAAAGRAVPRRPRDRSGRTCSRARAASSR